MRSLITLALLVSLTCFAVGCSARGAPRVYCEGKLVPINAPARGAETKRETKENATRDTAKKDGPR